MSLGLRDFQLEELRMLKAVSEKLNNAGVQFYLIGGSCIGALRHQGFIPWDDDVDVAVMRKDFQKAEKALSELQDNMMYDAVESHVIADAPIGHVYSLDYKSMDDAPRIDVFAIDNVPDSRLAEKFQKLCSMIYHVCVLRRPAENRGRLKRIFTYVICKFFPKFLLDFLQKMSYKGVTKWKDKPTKYVSNIYGVSGDKEKVPAEFYGTARYVPFEDTMMPIPEKAEEYNTQIYGNFMEYPPEEQRVPSHFKDF
ncbi:MAG: LicD family protein [Clostridia bacterium]|nr:LicD family protein [Clostridia bacterium]MBQ4644519.1 LicD family protein [Clostridia bacterium]